MIQLTDKAKCCGCTACYSICPKRCISMVEDTEGFSYPTVNADSCVNCGLCEKVCPVINKRELPLRSKAAFVVQHKDQSILKDSTSGGFCDALYRSILDRDGYICGCVYDEDWLPHHVITDDPYILSKFHSSKYAQSRLDNTFLEIRKLLMNGRVVCFVGTPCQVAGLKNYLRRDFSNLITVDLVCRSIPSPLLLREYLKWQEKRYKSKISYLNCRNKTYGYHHGSLVIEFENGKRYSGSNRVDPFMKAFHSDICSRPSCYECVFKTPTRCSDFTVFDCWQPESLTSEIKDNNKGYSNVIIHTDRGLKIFESLQKIDKWETTPQKMFQFTGGMESKAISKPMLRERFYQNLIEQDFEVALYDVVSVTIKDKAIESTKQVLYKFGIFELLQKIKNAAKR